MCYHFRMSKLIKKAVVAAALAATAVSLTACNTTDHIAITSIANMEVGFKYAIDAQYNYDSAYNYVQYTIKRKPSSLFEEIGSYSYTTELYGGNENRLFIERARTGQDTSYYMIEYMGGDNYILSNLGASYMASDYSHAKFYFPNFLTNYNLDVINENSTHFLDITIDEFKTFYSKVNALTDYGENYIVTPITYDLFNDDYTDSFIRIETNGSTWTFSTEVKDV